MINKSQKEFLENTYGLNIIDELLYRSDRDVSLIFDQNKKPFTAYILSGKLSALYLPDTDRITVSDMLNYIEEDNLLAEVEGKYNFVEIIKKRFNEFDEELYLYIPVKRKDKPLWLYVGFTRIKKHNLVLAKVHRIYEETPSNIIHYQKTYQDSLTRLFTRETLKMHLDYMRDFNNAYFLYLDIDGFKRINDKFGHQMGDKFLIDLSNHFISNWEPDVIYYRLGGDEFAIYCFNQDEDKIVKRVKELIDSVENLNEVTKRLKISTSVGIVKITPNNVGYHKLLNLGDKLMYEAKAKGPGNFILKND